MFQQYLLLLLQRRTITVQSKKTIATMKNLFKNLMLVAVAAMAFTACTEEQNEVNAVKEKTTIEFVASFEDDTRSYFGEKVDGVYPSAWSGDETLAVIANIADYQEVNFKNDEPGKFSASFDTQDITRIDIVSPAAAYDCHITDPDTQKVLPSFDLLTEQTPLENSVDPATHIVAATIEDVDATSVQEVTLEHQYAYGKMTLSGIDFEVDYVEISIIGYYDQGNALTLHADNVKNNVFWFTTTSNAWVTKFNVTAYDKEGNAYSKFVEFANYDSALKFNTGRVSSFTVSGLKKQESVPVMASAVATCDEYFSNGDPKYTIKFTNDDVTIICKVNTKGNLYLNEMEYSSNISYDNEGHISSMTWTGVGTPWPYTMTVEIVDGVYSIAFATTDYENNFKAHEAIFKGTIDGFGLPDIRERLASPVVEATPSETEAAITVEWGEVANAVGYEVTFDGQTYTTEELSMTFTGLKWSIEYTVSVVAIAEVDGLYRDSKPGTASATTIANPDPNAPDGTQEKPYVFNTCETTYEWNFPYFNFSCEENGAKLTITPDNTSNPFQVGEDVSLDCGAWYTDDCHYYYNDVECAVDFSNSTYTATAVEGGWELTYIKIRSNSKDVYYTYKGIITL